jgi:hypothetical protein
MDRIPPISGLRGVEPVERPRLLSPAEREEARRERERRRREKAAQDRPGHADHRS